MLVSSWLMLWDKSRLWVLARRVERELILCRKISIDLRQ